MKINANEIRVGNILEYENKLWAVMKTMHTQPGKGGAYMQVEMKDIKSKTKVNVRFRSNESIEKAQLEQINYQYLYIIDDKISLMNVETYEQIEISLDSIPDDQAPFLREGIILKVEFYKDSPVIVNLPDVMDVVVTECEPIVKGQTAASSYKPAIIENGLRIMVPPFINSGDRILINTSTKEYLERAK